MSRITVAVLNIGWTCTKADLRAYFKKFGTVHGVQIPMNYDTGFNKNIAFLHMSGSKGFADKMLQDYHLVDGNEVTVKLREQGKGPRDKMHIIPTTTIETQVLE